MAEAPEARAEAPGSEVWRAVQIFCLVAFALVAAYLASALLAADLSVFRDPNGRFGILRIARFNAALGLVFAYVCASVWLRRRWVRRDFSELRTVVEASEAEWTAWTARIRTPAASMLVPALLGACCGLAVDFVGGRASDSSPSLWRGHLIWIWILNPVLFAAMGVLVRMSSGLARIYRELGRRARVTLGDLSPLAPFVRAGLRTALFWFVGTSLASVLLVDTDAPWLVISILLATTGIAATSLLAPIRGVHECLRDAKRRELRWLRAEIARASEALRRGEPQGAAQLPALLAWESRVASAPEWPFDASTWLRFALLPLVPLGSWLGGAVAERVVQRWFGP